MEFECRDLCKVYSVQGRPVSTLEDVSFTVMRQEFVGIVGPSGCGKTTLLKIIAGLVKPSSGRITFGETDTGGQPHNAMVFQEHALLPWLTVLDNVAFGLEMQGMKTDERHERAASFIEQIGLADFADSYPYQLSGGMCQRAAIARAFVADPYMLLMDEPFSSLDAQTKLVLQEELLRIWGEHKKTVIYVTHDIEEAVLLSDRVLVMTGRPGSIRREIPVALPRPRTLLANESREVKEIKWRIWKMLESEVRQSLELKR
ncbi:MAG: ABC transporter ATP-binding protein [Spirochaetes bacterium]|nr:ABC transporter ATP-binding protein [Spirochaetota bacterium]